MSIIFNTIGLVLAVVMGYFVGSVPFSLIISELCGIGDIRQMGSGNVGATNVLRNGNLAVGIMALILDLCKGIIAFSLCKYFYITRLFALEAGVISVVGHIYPVWLNFSGGKGVATLIGVVLAFNGYLGAGFVMTWFIMFLTFRYSSISSISALLFLIIASAVFFDATVFIPLIVLSCLVLYRHKDNMRRFMDGKEQQLNVFDKLQKKNVF